jgi:hypothetical protein
MTSPAANDAAAPAMLLVMLPASATTPAGTCILTSVTGPLPEAMTL